MTRPVGIDSGRIPIVTAVIGNDVTGNEGENTPRDRGAPLAIHTVRRHGIAELFTLSAAAFRARVRYRWQQGAAGA
jgi:hypothetical protein